MRFYEVEGSAREAEPDTRARLRLYEFSLDGSTVVWGYTTPRRAMECLGILVILVLGGFVRVADDRRRRNLKPASATHRVAADLVGKSGEITKTTKR